MDRPNADVRASDSLADVSAKPYSPDGGLHAEGLALTAAAGAAAGLAAGLVFGIVGQWFYAILVFPLFIGTAVGAVQSFVIKKTKVRNTLACGAIGLLAGLLAVVTMHYVDYEAFKNDMAEADAEIEMFCQEVRAGVYTQAEFDQAMREYNQNPEMQAMRAVHSFPEYLDWSAHQGVVLSSSKSSTPINLGYTGTYVYWGADALIIAAMVIIMTRSQAAEPFCQECDRWKDGIEMGRLQASPTHVAASIGSGRLSTLPNVAPNKRSLTSIKAYVCGTCQSPEDVVIEVNEVTYPNGKETFDKKGRFVCDATAIDELTKFFDDGKSEEPVDEVTKQLLAASESAYASGRS